MHDAKRRTWLPRLVALVVVLTAALAAGPLRAVAGANLRGKVTGWEKLVPQVYADPTKNESHRYTWREPSPTVRQDFRKLSANVSRDVCVAAFGSGTAQAHDPVGVKVTGGRMTPATIVLAPGSRLSFKMPTHSSTCSTRRRAPDRRPPKTRAHGPRTLRPPALRESGQLRRSECTKFGTSSFPAS